ncbi:hypothetical protein [Phycicoccus flavus]|uniref:Uncharacterized protein n=1 Tax=Phycicoccus flavus TaxID=2502783 RepID=A0A8T6R3B5_9MICO|nr:hypothetical protein [Phycicoccus flavus]NHA67285.1 hypothetical protein [Phycicoccus flavus]
MADLRPRRTLALAGAVALVVVLTVLRGPVILLAAGTVGIVVGAVLVLLPLLRADPVDWDWRPDLEHDLPPEPGIAELHRTLAPTPRDTGAPARLHALVTVLAADRSPHGVGGDGPLATYLAAPPRPLGLPEVERVVADLEALPAPTEET